MAKPKTLAQNRRRRRARKNAAHMVMNPPVFKDLAKQVAPAIAAYAATRLLSRIVYMLTARRWPRASRHLAAASSVAVVGAAYYGGAKIKQLAAYQDSVLIGAGIASAQTMLQTYVPRYGWIVSDYKDADLGPAKSLPAPADDDAGDLGEYVGDEFSYLEEEVAAVAPPPALSRNAAPAPAPVAEDEFTEEEMAFIDDGEEGGEDYGNGIFAH